MGDDGGRERKTGSITVLRIYEKDTSTLRLEADSRHHDDGGDLSLDLLRLPIHDPIPSPNFGNTDHEETRTKIETTSAISFHVMSSTPKRLSQCDS